MIDIINDNFNDLAKDYYKLQEEYEQLEQENKQLKDKIDKAIELLYELEENMNKDLKKWIAKGLKVKHIDILDIKNIIKILGDKENE